MLFPNFIRKLYHKKTFCQIYNYIKKDFGAITGAPIMQARR